MISSKQVSARSTSFENSSAQTLTKISVTTTFDELARLLIFGRWQTWTHRYDNTGPHQHLLQLRPGA